MNVKWHQAEARIIKIPPMPSEEPKRKEPKHIALLLYIPNPSLPKVI